MTPQPAATHSPAHPRPSWLGRLLYGWCEHHHEHKTRVALVGERVIRARGSEPRFCASCAREFAG